MSLWKNIQKFMADRRGKAKLVAILGEVLVFVVLVPVITSLMTGLVNTSEGVAATIYGLTGVILSIIFFYILYRQIKSE